MTESQRINRLKELFEEAELLLKEQFAHRVHAIRQTKELTHIHKDLEEKQINLVSLWKKQFTNMSLKR